MSLDRREFLKWSAGALAVGAAAPALLACGSDDVAPINDAWQSRADALEGQQASVYSVSDPGPWAGKEGSHVPSMAVAAQISVDSSHGMTKDQADTDDHWITTVYVKDQDGVVIHLQEFDGSEEVATISFAPPESTSQVTAFAYCNLHGLWQSDAMPV
jgi:desulfoferrodoxin (superoxide reductase-like protein)